MFSKVIQQYAVEFNNSLKQYQTNNHARKSFWCGKAFAGTIRGVRFYVLFYWESLFLFLWAMLN